MATTGIKMPKRTPGPPGGGASRRTRLLGVLGLIALAVVLYLSISLKAGGHLAGPTYIAPGNVGLVIDNYHGKVAQTLPAGLQWQGLWETIIEVPTAQRTITLSNGTDANGQAVQNAVQVNTISNMLQVDVSAQYQIDAGKADQLYASYQDQFADLRQFEGINLEPALKEAINYAIGDMDTATALTTAGKQKAEQAALKTLNDEWAPRGIEFSQLMIRGIEQDQASKDLLSTTLSKMQEIENAKLALQQQRFDNETLLSQAMAEAKVNRLQNSTLTDLYVQDQLLGQVKTLYLPSDELMESLKK